MTQPAARPHQPPSLSGWRALWRVLTDPVETFRRLGDSPPVLPGYLLQMLVGAVVLALTWGTVVDMLDQVMAATADQSGEGAPPELGPIMTWVAVGTTAATTLGAPWLTGLLLTLVALFLGQFQGGGVPFSAYFGMIGYARVPLALSTLVAGLWTAVTGSPLQLSAAILLSPEASPYLKGLLSMLNPFGLWYYALLAVGFASLFGRPPRRGWALSALLFLVATLLTVGMAPLASDQVGMFQ